MSFWQGRRVLITGHTGFKGAWLSLWLSDAGARITGIALEPDTRPSLFEQLALADSMDHRLLDIRNFGALLRAVEETSPDIVLHLAAQSLVLRAYREPIETWNVNVMGTVHVLEALRHLGKKCAAVIVTTDKVYENREWEFGYRESDPLGGYDPYSASKAATEIAVSSWRRSFFAETCCVRIASARAGNVIGGGDWSENRVVPDVARALSAGKPVPVRNRHATRPWQHVLEPLSGYLRLAEHLFESDDACYQDAYNFGPHVDANRTVGELVAECLTHWKGSSVDNSVSRAPHEASRLALVIDRARERLGWRPIWDFARSVEETMAWYRAAPEFEASALRDFSVAQIHRYKSDDNAAH